VSQGFVLPSLSLGSSSTAHSIAKELSCSVDGSCSTQGWSLDAVLFVLPSLCRAPSQLKVIQHDTWNKHAWWRVTSKLHSGKCRLLQCLAEVLLRLLFNCDQTNKNASLLSKNKQEMSLPTTEVAFELASTGQQNNESQHIWSFDFAEFVPCQAAPQAPPQLHTTTKNRQRCRHFKVGCLKVLSCPASP
jgi:hypothetical protein